MRRTAVSLVAGALVLAGVALAHPAAADTAWLGVYSQAITPELREGLNYNGSGALVTRVLPDSPADRAGIERGDVIVSVGGSSVDSPDALADAVRSSTAGRATEVTVVRDGAKKSIRVMLASRSETQSPEMDRTPMPRRMDRGEPDSSEEPEEMEAPEAPDAPEAPEAPEAPDTPEPPDAPRMHMERHGDRDGNGRDFMIHLPDMMGQGTRGRLGVRIETLNPDLASYFGSREAKGALVLDVTDGSAAEKAGIHAGDVITRVGTKPVENADDLVEAVRSGEGTVPITLLRHGSRQTVQATLAKSPRIMRFENGPQGMNWKSLGGRNWKFEGPGANGNMKRIIIDGDGPDADPPAPGQPLAPRRMRMDGDRSMIRGRTPAARESMDAMREQIEQLKDQIEQLRREMKSNDNR